jgi:hypothetical protein
LHSELKLTLKIIMSRFYRLTITERVATLEVIVELPGSLWEGQSKDVVHPRLNVVAADAVRQRWRMLHPDEPYPVIMPERFEIQSLSDFDSNMMVAAPGFGPFSVLGARAYITKFPSGLAF